MTAHAEGVLTIGQTFTKLLVTDLKRTQLVQYAGASGDYNPLHSDEPHARQVAGFPGVFAHGMLTMAMTGTLVSDVFGIANVSSFGGRFMAQVWPGDTLVARLEIVEIVGASGEAAGAGGDATITATVTTTNQDGVVVFTGRAVARPDLGRA